MGEHITKLLFDPNGPFGMTEAFFQNAAAEFAGFILGALVFSILIPIVIDARQGRWGLRAFGRRMRSTMRIGRFQR